MKRKLTIGIFAHVDAGKTTLSEALLYRSGAIRTLGRVDHKNTFLDTNRMERERGITIFSKQARFSCQNQDFILLDTPGHVDFSPETERTLSLLDYAILVISAPDGVQNHTRTLWQLLEYYNVPTFVFINKMDIATVGEEELERQLTKNLASGCVFMAKVDRDERIALLDDELLEEHLAGNEIEEDSIQSLIAARRLFPCYLGSALRMHGIDEFLFDLDRYTLPALYDDTAFGAKVYKIQRVGNLRMTYLKITGGSLACRDELIYRTPDGKQYAEKISQIRLYSGDKFEQVDRVFASEICAVSGLSATYAGQGLGREKSAEKPVLEPVLSYRLCLPPECDPVLCFTKFKELEEEEPSLQMCYNDQLSQIEVRLMGEIQIDLLVHLIADRFGIVCTLDAGRILYKEKIEKKALGIGHFEPLRHYAEVQLLLEPAPSGSGLVFDNRLAVYDLDTNWQRLILSHLYEKDHRGICIGAPLTDTKITLVGGKGHLKHTEGGDFREATLRAVRHGLMRGGCTLLEPYYRFRLELPSSSVGRAMTDLQNKCCECTVESANEDASVLVGRGPVATLHNYTKEVISYTRGVGRLSLVSDGYATCHNADDILLAVGYDPTADLENPPHSVFCAGGAGFVVPWDEVEHHKHLDVGITPTSTEEIIPKVRHLQKKYELSDEDLEAIMLREFGPIKRRKYSEPRGVSIERKKEKKKVIPPQQHLIIIDGYNVIYAWENLKEIAAYSLEKAREALMDILSNYVGYTKTELLLVFDAYLVKDGMGSTFQKDGYTVVFTKEDQTADAYIEKVMAEMGPNYNIRVVTADRLLQYSAVHSGIARMTPKEFEDEVIKIGNEIRAFVRKLAKSSN